MCELYGGRGGEILTAWRWVFEKSTLVAWPLEGPSERGKQGELSS